MAEHDIAADYNTNPTDKELAALDDYIRTHPPVRDGDRVQGAAECPHCHWLIDYSIDRTYLLADEEVVKILLECDCGVVHPSAPKDTVDCGFEAMAAIPIPEDVR